MPRWTLLEEGREWQPLTMLHQVLHLQRGEGKNLELSGECDLEDGVEEVVSQGQPPWQSSHVMCGNLMFLSGNRYHPIMKQRSTSQSKEEVGRKNVRM
jgi:hypothetical protein